MSGYELKLNHRIQYNSYYSTYTNKKRAVPGEYEELSHHSCALTDELLHELRAGHTDERAVRVVSHGACQQSLAGAWRSEQEHSLSVTTFTSK